MIYSDVSLKTLVNQGFLPEGVQIGPSSVDLTLSNTFCVLDANKDYVFDPFECNSVDNSNNFSFWENDSIVLYPMEFVLASTEEEIGVPIDCAAYVEGRSSVGRIGIQVQNAGFIDAGFRGQITLELQNQSKCSIRLRAGMRICQLVYVQMTSPSNYPYSGKYQFQEGATESYLYQDIQGVYSRKTS